MMILPLGAASVQKAGGSGEDNVRISCGFGDHHSEV